MLCARQVLVRSGAQQRERAPSKGPVIFALETETAFSNPDFENNHNLPAAAVGHGVRREEKPLMSANSR
jgi:hypothetical protein